jgi:hypothetical protein
MMTRTLGTTMALPSKEEVQAAIDNYIADLAQPLRALNEQVRSKMGKAFLFLTKMIDL